MDIIKFETGSLGANCYIISSNTIGVSAGSVVKSKCAVIDPGGNLEDILGVLESKNLECKYILLTHGHFDHIGAVKAVKDNTKAKIAIHSEDADMLTDANKSLSLSMGSGITQYPADILLKDGDELEIGDIILTVLHTPGHTRGGVTYKGDGVLFTGDALFKNSIGRTDLQGGSYDTLLKSIHEKLMVFSDDYIVYPGHGEATTIGRERKSNPFLV